MTTGFSVVTKQCIESPASQSAFRKANLLLRLQDAGYVAPSGRWFLEEFLCDFCNYFEGRFTDLRLRTLSTEAELVLAMVQTLRSGRTSLHPVGACLISWFCDENVCERSNHLAAVCQLVSQGATTREVAVSFGISVAAVNKIRVANRDYIDAQSRAQEDRQKTEGGLAGDKLVRSSPGKGRQRWGCASNKKPVAAEPRQAGLPQPLRRRYVSSGVQQTLLALGEAALERAVDKSGNDRPLPNSRYRLKQATAMTTYQLRYIESTRHPSEVPWEIETRSQFVRRRREWAKNRNSAGAGVATDALARSRAAKDSR